MRFGEITLDFSKLGGLVPVVLQHARTREVVMVGFVDEEAWRATLRTGLVTLFRRTLGRVQVKGEDGDGLVRIQRVVVDCDADSVLLEVLPEGDVCHLGGATCFTIEASAATSAATSVEASVEASAEASGSEPGGAAA